MLHNNRLDGTADFMWVPMQTKRLSPLPTCLHLGATFQTFPSSFPYLQRKENEIGQDSECSYDQHAGYRCLPAFSFSISASFPGWANSWSSSDILSPIELPPCFRSFHTRPPLCRSWICAAKTITRIPECQSKAVGVGDGIELNKICDASMEKKTNKSGKKNEKWQGGKGCLVLWF